MIRFHKKNRFYQILERNIFHLWLIKYFYLLLLSIFIYDDHTKKYDESDNYDIDISYIFNINFSIPYRHNKSRTITSWYITNINFNVKCMIWSICILWNRKKIELFHRIISLISSISIHNDFKKKRWLE